MGAPLLLMALRPPLPPAFLLLLLAGAGAAYELGIQRRFLDVVPEHARGQAFGLVGTLVMFGQGVGPVLAGALASVWSPSTAIGVTGAAVTASGLAHGPHLRPPGRPVS